MSNFPTLQGEDSKGKMRMWSVRVFLRDGCGVIETTYGLLGGKMIVNQRDVCVGKNIGKKNETTPLQQAVAEARSSWVKTKESGYHEVVLEVSKRASPLKASQCAAEQKVLDAAQAAYAACHAALPKAARAASPKAARAASPKAARAASPKAARAAQDARATSRKIKRPTFPKAQGAEALRANSPKAIKAQGAEVRANSPKASEVRANSQEMTLPNAFKAEVRANTQEMTFPNAFKAEVQSPKDEPKKERGKGIDASVPLPMLAHDYNKRGKGAIYPCFVQPKLDGTRCIGIPGKGLFSRMRKSFPHMEHIVAELNQLPADVILDGELYTNELTFQQIVWLVKKETLREGNAENQEKIKYHVYDMVSPGTFEERYAALTKLIRGHRLRHIVLVPTERCASEERMKAKHNEYVAEGFEGIMLRNPAGLYQHSRSTDLLKYKEFFDAEYEVVGFKEGEGQEKGCVLWTCKTEDGKTFHCRPRGTREDRVELFHHGLEYVGKKLTVRFQELTDEGLPRFPVGIAFRDYE